MQHLLPNSTLQSGKYKIIKVLGQGGFGITYLAEHTMLYGKVAIKEFFYKDCCERQEGSSLVSIPTKVNEELVERFKLKFIKEARTIYGLNHPNIVSIYDLFEENNTAYYVMEYIEGRSLGNLVKETGKLSLSNALGYIKKVAGALSYIHSKNIMHLDIKPANLMVRHEDDDIRVIDFGLSKQYDEESGGQTSTTPVGISNGYAPIEQYRQGGVSTFSPQTDIYSLTATFYKLITGVTPPEPMVIINDGLPELPIDIPQSICDAIEIGMEIKKNKRPATVDEWIKMFENNKFKADEVVSEKTVTKNEIVDKPNNTELQNEDDATILLNRHYSEVVDMGLSVNWCTCNIGADKETDSGNYYVLSSLKNAEKSVESGLRFPTKEEWDELLTWCEYEDVSGNLIFKGRNGNKLAIPLSGRLYQGEEDQKNKTALYWSAPNNYENKLWFTRVTDKETSVNNIVSRTRTDIAMPIRLVKDK